MDTWVVAIKRRLTPPLPASVLGHFSGTILDLEVVGRVSEEAARKVRGVAEEDACGNLVIKPGHAGKLNTVLPSLAGRDREVLESALNMLGNESEILLLRE